MKNSIQILIIILSGFFFNLNARSQLLDANNLSGKITGKEIVASVLECSPRNYEIKFERTAYGFRDEQKQLVKNLLDIFESQKSSNLQKSAAIFYLGELRDAEYVGVLSTNIAFQFNAFALNTHGLPIIHQMVVMEALVKIGNPSIPAVLRNLAESDDAKVRELSLQVIERIDNDQDISALRLQKAIKAEADPQKKARLQKALETLVASH